MKLGRGSTNWGRTTFCISRDPLPQALLEHFHRGKRFGRLWAEAVDGELCGLTGSHIYVQKVILLLRSLVFPIQVRRVVCREIRKMRSAGKNRVLLCASAT